MPSHSICMIFPDTVRSPYTHSFPHAPHTPAHLSLCRCLSVAVSLSLSFSPSPFPFSFSLALSRYMINIDTYTVDDTHTGQVLRVCVSVRVCVCARARVCLSYRAGAAGGVQPVLPQLAPRRGRLRPHPRGVRLHIISKS